MGPVWEKSTHIYLPEKHFLHIFTQMIISPSPSPFDGLVRSQPIETYVRVQVIALKI